MIKHVVLFKLQSFAEGHSKHENALYLKRELEDLQSVIPELLKMEVFINMPEVSAENYDLMLMAEFDSLEDLKVYSDHPEHLKVASYMSKVRENRAAIDYNI